MPVAVAESDGSGPARAAASPDKLPRGHGARAAGPSPGLRSTAFQSNGRCSEVFAWREKVPSLGAKLHFHQCSSLENTKPTFETIRDTSTVFQGLQHQLIRVAIVNDWLQWSPWPGTRYTLVVHSSSDSTQAIPVPDGRTRRTKQRPGSRTSLVPAVSRPG